VLGVFYPPGVGRGDLGDYVDLTLRVADEIERLCMLDIVAEDDLLQARAALLVPVVGVCL